jgi:hypothetical protein
MPQGWGCGDRKSDRYVPDFFFESCRKHDDCYVDQCGQRQCDQNFYNDMRDERPDMNVTARIYYQMVRWFGDSAYETAGARQPTSAPPNKR